MNSNLNKQKIDENIHPDQAAQIIGKENAEVVSDYSIRLYSQVSYIYN